MQKKKGKQIISFNMERTMIDTHSISYVSNLEERLQQGEVQRDSFAGNVYAVKDAQEFAKQIRRKGFLDRGNNLCNGIICLENRNSFLETKYMCGQVGRDEI